jgi:hypothetical protein
LEREVAEDTGIRSMPLTEDGFSKLLPFLSKKQCTIAAPIATNQILGKIVIAWEREFLVVSHLLCYGKETIL